MQTIDIADAVNDCAYILSFLDATFTFPQRKEITLSYEAHSGLSLILGDLSQRPFKAADSLEVQP